MSGATSGAQLRAHAACAVYTRGTSAAWTAHHARRRDITRCDTWVTRRGVGAAFFLLGTIDDEAHGLTSGIEGKGGLEAVVEVHSLASRRFDGNVG